MCLNLLGWFVFGGLAGWLASIITGRNNRQGCLMNVIVGVIGAFIGGAIYSLIWGDGVNFGFTLNISSLTGFIVAVAGAVILLLIVNLFTRRR